MADSAVPPAGPVLGPPAAQPPTMFAPATATPAQPGAPSQSPGGEIEVNLDMLRTFCGGSLQSMITDAERVRADFLGTPISATLFSDADVGAEFAAQHRAAFEVYDATLRGAVEDLRRLQDNLRTAIANYEREDDAATEVLQRLSRTMLSEGYASTRAHDAAVQARTTAPTGSAPSPAAGPPATEENAGGAFG